MKLKPPTKWKTKFFLIKDEQGIICRGTRRDDLISVQNLLNLSYIKYNTYFNQSVFGKKPQLKEGIHVFSVKKNGEYNDFIVGVVTGIKGRKVGVNGIIINPVGLKNKVSQGKAGERSLEILTHPNPDNIILAMVYRVEHENFAEVLDLDQDKCDLIPPVIYATVEGWIRESLPELVNNILSLPDGPERDQAKRVLRQKADSLVDKKLKRTLYAVSRSLKILN